MSRQMKRMLIIVGIVLALIFGWYGVKKIMFWWFSSHYAPPPVTVNASTVQEKNWQSYLTSVGTLTAAMGVNISGETGGIVKEVRFDSGQSVQKGDVLFLLDTSIEQAQLKDRRAQLKLAELNYQRDQTLMKRNAISEAAQDISYARYKQASAAVEEMEARIQQKTLTAPFSGKTGIRKIDVGEYISAGEEMVTLQALDPLRVRFNLPEQYLLDIALDQAVDVTVNLSHGNKTIRGKITAINSKVNETTRNILVEATIPNTQMQLYPGMYADVKIWLHERKNVLTIPQTAISYSLHGDSVFIIKNDEKDKNKKPLLHAYRQYVEVGARRNNEVEIIVLPKKTSELKVNDTVVTSGQLKLQNGTHVIVDNSVEL
ncbi:MAG TPA: efflux RND transporter periplasmic adaptor subunit [Gammaproteobacteria bacterium]|jgi:membrane fusion protein (multidrug efflux system)|nr:efflux RND transporter periplasmic adaptor subunit [Gammaproteobacteria bacterium]